MYIATTVCKLATQAYRLIFQSCDIYLYKYCFINSRAKHPVKVHVWGGISMRGPTGICIFEGKIDAAMYIDILKTTLKPFIDEVYLHTPHRKWNQLVENSCRVT